MGLNLFISTLSLDKKFTGAKNSQLLFQKDPMCTEEYPIEIDVHATQSLFGGGEDFLLLDCREQHENDHCRIEGSMLIPMNETPSRVEELEEYRDKRIVVHCHHGVRSLSVAQWLRNNGFPRVQSMAGGIDAWSLEINSDVARY